MTSGPAVHLYPPDKGWVRVDPAAALREASLLDLVLLVEDPAALAAMLVQLSEERHDRRIPPTRWPTRSRRFPG